MIDTHCHLCDTSFKDDIEDVVLRAVTTGIRGVLTLTEERSDFSLALELKKRFPDWINLGFGIHPMQKREDGSGLCRSVNLKVGLDFSPCVCPTTELHAVQRAVLTHHIHLSKDLNLPLNVHSRSASKPTLELLKSEGKEGADISGLTDQRNSILSHVFSPAKCNVMLVNMESPSMTLTIQGEALDVVGRFTYLGGCISSNCGVTDEVSTRICKVRVAFDNLRDL
ncbi:hypothetical protein T265_09438 [Opisthorchis viverrini]|uniref:Hydrolase, TatD family n=1 Tax=Opisthorchis viverrini TaxID=6198 RepID=A0A075A4Y7_OPIVI|nr:hypothetical protein T265_09438 [Opisthorchis viverrini]KER22489.1 hypothetical protein T265_09438 [Opisthorchis viverrini]